MAHEDLELSTIANARFDPSAVPETAFTLAVVEGPNAGLRIVMDDDQPSRLLVGQSPVCGLRVTDREVSRRHAAIEWVDGRLRISDLGSKNGTFVDGVEVGEARLRGGETIRAGSTSIRVERTPRAGSAKLSPECAFGRLLGASREMRRLYPLCRKLADVNVPVVIEGETGTGKEILAEALHEEGPRANGPYIVFDCTSVSPALVESELFGHERGAFTGADAQRRGVFELAHGGTLLIDEIGDLEPALQPKLLRAVERSEFRRVGGTQPIKVDVRVLSATRRDLDREVQAGRFRDDLFHRLTVARIELPPLRVRRGDVSLLARHFARLLGQSENAIAPAVLARWEERAWPGNVRELRNHVARFLALGEEEARAQGERSATSAATPADYGLDRQVAQLLAERAPLVAARRKVVDAFERVYLDAVLRAHGGNVVRAAPASGIARRYFQILRARGRTP